MQLSSIQVLAAVFSFMIILKFIVVILLPNKSFKKLMHSYENINFNFIYYIYSILGLLLFYYIYSSMNISFSEILVISMPVILIYGAGIVKIFDGKMVAKAMNKFDSAFQLYTSLWILWLFWLVISIMTLKEIFFS